ncbi:MAG TPA: ATP-binding protein [Burkholderiales bacterium]|jgi:signal transduction histidine kinase|nr:ATP-binding protein [Burkholderiales bacterium]
MPTLLTGGALANRRQRLRAYIMASALLVLIAGAFTLISWDSVVKRFELQLQTQAVMGAQGVDTYFVMMEKAFGELARELQAQGLGAQPQVAAAPGAAETLARFRLRYPEFEIIVINRLEGDSVISTSGAAAALRSNISREPSYVLAMEELAGGAQMAVSRPFKGPISHRWSTPLRFAVRDAQGKLLYTIAGGLSLERTHEFWKDAPLPEGAGMGIVRDDSWIIARYPRVASMTLEKLYTRPAPGVIGEYLRAHNGQQAGTVRATSGVTGMPTMVSFQRLRHYPLSFFVANLESTLVAAWWAFAWPTYVLMLAFFTGGVAIVSWIGRRQGELQAEREKRVAILEEQALKDRALNEQLDLLSRSQLASNAELQRLAGNLSASNARLEETNAELEAFMYSVSHDLRAPIRAVDSYAALLQESLAVDPASDAGGLIARVRASARRMADLLNDLLDLSRYSTKVLERERIEMRAEVDSVIAELGADTELKVERARFEIGALPPCLGDRVLTRQIWLNLIANALKFSARREVPQIRIGFADGAYFVADNGTGFDMAFADKLFKLFSRLHHESDFKGTGIGLAIVKRITERMGGHIGAEGAVEQGATFSFVLPM